MKFLTQSFCNTVHSPFWILLLMVCAGSTAHAQTYSKAIDLLNTNDARSGVLTSDGGYVFTGVTTDDLGDHPYIAKADAQGDILWSEEFGLNFAAGNRVEQLATGGFIIAGKSQSATSANPSGLLLRTDASGNQLWSRTYGESDPEEFYAVQEQFPLNILDPYRFVAAGVAFNGGSRDIYVAKMGDNGNLLAGKTYDFGANDIAYTVLKVPGGFLVAGATNLGIAGTSNTLVMKLDQALNVVWSNTYGGAGNEEGIAITSTSDGNAVVAGYSDSYSNGKQDIFLLKLNTADGSLMWSRVFGRRADEIATSVQETADGGLVLTGWHRPNNSASQDAFLLKLDATGTLLWDERYGTPNNDIGFSVKEASDGALHVAGELNLVAPSSDDLGDALIIKTDALGQGACEEALNFLSQAVTTSPVALTPTVNDYGTSSLTLQYFLDAETGVRSICCSCDDVTVDFSYLTVSSCFSSTPPGIRVGDVVEFQSETNCTDRLGWFVNGDLVSTDPNYSWTPAESGVYVVSLKGRLEGCSVVEHTKILTVSPGCYCPSSGSSSFFSHISSFCWTDICVATGDDGGYGYPGVNFTASKASPNYFSIDPAIFSIPLTATFNLWIDYDQSGTFDIANGELVFANIGTGSQSGFISIPMDAADGTTLMRVQLKLGGTGTVPDPCETFSNGEVEDYLLTILPARLGTAVPEQLTAWPNPASELIHVQFEGANTASLLSLTDLNGRTVFQQKLNPTSASQTLSIPVADLAEGLYIVSVKQGAQITHSKVQVSH